MSTKKGGKFVSRITASDSSIKESRAKNLEMTVKMEVEDLIRKLTKDKLALETEIEKLSDLAPDTTYSLRPGGKDFDARSWVTKLHQAKLDLKLKNIELEEAESILNEWF